MPTVTKTATAAGVAAGSPFNGSWSSEQNVRNAGDINAAGDGLYATCAPGKNQEFASLWPFAFAAADIPDDSSVDAVSVKVQWKVSTTSSVATLASSAWKESGQTNALTAVPAFSDATEPTADKDSTYSLVTLPTLAELRAGIWVRVQAMRGNTNTAVTFSLDYIQVTVTYTAGTVNNDSGAGTLALSGSGTGSQTASDAGAGTVALSGAGADASVRSASGAGTLALSGSGTELFQPPGTVYTDAGSGTLALSGSGARSSSRSGNGTGTMRLTGSGVEVASRAQTVTGTIVFSGYGTESFTGGGGGGDGGNSRSHRDEQTQILLLQRPYH